MEPPFGTSRGFNGVPTGFSPEVSGTLHLNAPSLRAPRNDAVPIHLDGGTQTLTRMKIRLQSGSIRFRLRQRDVQCLLQTGIATVSVRLGDADFSCILEIGVGSPGISLTPSGIRARVSGDDARRWASGGEVGLYYTLPEGTRLMVEKDWACMEPSPGDSNEDTFPRPGSI